MKLYSNYDDFFRCKSIFCINMNSLDFVFKRNKHESFCLVSWCNWHDHVIWSCEKIKNNGHISFPINYFFFKSVKSNFWNVAYQLRGCDHLRSAIIILISKSQLHVDNLNMLTFIIKDIEPFVKNRNRFNVVYRSS